MKIKDIDIRLDELKKNLEENQNRRTEVYSRIVGYYRSVKNWNKGKKEEFGIRRTFSVNCIPAKLGNQEVQETSPVESVVPVKEASIETASTVQNLEQGDLFGNPESNSSSKDEVHFRFYFRRDCPNCPPMKQFVSSTDLKGDHIDVDQEENLQLAIADNVYTAPTVILLSDKNEEIFRTDNVAGLEEYLSQVKEAIAL